MDDTNSGGKCPRFGFDEQGLGADAVIRELDSIARAEDSVWADGRCSGTIYCGDRAIYDLSAEAFGRFSYVNALQRDMCPSQTRFESEIIAMTLDMLHGGAARARGQEPCGVIGSGGTESILAAIYAHREWGHAEKGIEAPEMILPETAHVAFGKGAHYFGVRVIPAPVDPQTTLVDVDFVRKHVGRNTVLLVGSAGNYPYGTIDPIGALSDLAMEHGVGLHVDGCLGGFILPWGEQLGYEKVERYARLLGLGEPSGINLTGETAGRLPPFVRPEAVGHLSSHATGIETSAMQLAVLVSATVNGGVILRPQMSGPQDFVPRERWRLPETTRLEGLAAGFAAAVNEGSASAAFDPEVAVAGKTGTCAQLGWFASYAPAGRPELVVVVFIEHGGQGSRAAAPLARALHAHYFRVDLGTPAAS